MTAVPLFKAAETATGIGTAADEVCVLQLHAVCRIFEQQDTLERQGTPGKTG